MSFIARKHTSFAASSSHSRSGSYQPARHSSAQRMTIAPLASPKEQKPAAVKRPESTQTPPPEVKVPLRGNTSKTNKLAHRRVVPLGNQKQKVSPVPKKAGSPARSSPSYGSSNQNNLTLRTRRAQKHKSSNSSDDSSDIACSEYDGIQAKTNTGCTPKDPEGEFLHLGSHDIKVDSDFLTPTECWRCGKSAPPKIVGEPTSHTHFISFLLCVFCLTPLMYLPYWCEYHSTPTKRCRYCGAYFTEPPPRDTRTG